MGEEENFTRLMLFIEKPCLKMMKEFFDKRLEETSPGLSVDGFLNNNRTRILQTKHGKYNKNKYFPPGGTQTDDWDLGMLYHITSYFPACHHVNHIMGHLNVIKQIRDKLCHLGKPLVRGTEYDGYRKSIGDFLTDTVTYVNNNDLQDAIQKDIKYIERPMSRELIEIHTNIHKTYDKKGIEDLIE